MIAQHREGRRGYELPHFSKQAAGGTARVLLRAHTSLSSHTPVAGRAASPSAVTSLTVQEFHVLLYTLSLNASRKPQPECEGEP